MKQYGKKRIFFGCLAAAMAVGLLAGGLWWSGRAEPTFARLTQQTLIIDPGHGGEDGGAVSASGQAESQINLAIARSLDQLMGFYGVPAVMTRTEDISIHAPSAETLREKKVSDLKNRVALINSIPNATLISIHQNASPNPSHRGFQVFYGDQALSQPLVQESGEGRAFLGQQGGGCQKRLDLTVLTAKADGIHSAKLFWWSAASCPTSRRTSCFKSPPISASWP